MAVVHNTEQEAKLSLG